MSGFRTTIARWLLQLAARINPTDGVEYLPGLSLEPQLLSEEDFPTPTPSIASLPEYGNGGHGIYL